MCQPQIQHAIERFTPPLHAACVAATAVMAPGTARQNPTSAGRSAALPLIPATSPATRTGRPKARLASRWNSAASARRDRRRRQRRPVQRDRHPVAGEGGIPPPGRPPGRPPARGRPRAGGRRARPPPPAAAPSRRWTREPPRQVRHSLRDPAPTRPARARRSFPTSGRRLASPPSTAAARRSRRRTGPARRARRGPAPAPAPAAGASSARPVPMPPAAAGPAAVLARRQQRRPGGEHPVGGLDPHAAGLGPRSTGPPRAPNLGPRPLGLLQQQASSRSRDSPQARNGKSPSARTRPAISRTRPIGAGASPASVASASSASRWRTASRSRTRRRPLWCGNDSRSSSTTCRPARASRRRGRPCGPPPATTTSRLTSTAARNVIASAVRPGAKASAQPGRSSPPRASTSLSTNITVADDMCRSRAKLAATGRAPPPPARARPRPRPGSPPARVHGPGSDLARVAATQEAPDAPRQAARDRPRHRPVQPHEEPALPDVPADLVAALRDTGAAEACDPQALRLGAHQARGTAVGEDHERQNALELGGPCRWIVHSSRLTVSTRASGRERTMWRASFSAGSAAWQPMKPTSVRSTPGPSPRCSMSWMSSPGASKPVQLVTIRCVTPSSGPKPARRVERQPQRVLFVEPHPRRGVREGAATEEADPVQHLRLGVGRDVGAAVLDLRPLGHAPEQPPRPLVGQHRGRVVEELAVDIVGRHRGGDPVDVDGHHRVQPQRSINRRSCGPVLGDRPGPGATRDTSAVAPGPRAAGRLRHRRREVTDDRLRDERVCRPWSPWPATAGSAASTAHAARHRRRRRLRDVHTLASRSPLLRRGLCRRRARPPQRIHDRRLQGFTARMRRSRSRATAVSSRASSSLERRSVRRSRTSSSGPPAAASSAPRTTSARCAVLHTL